MNRNQYRGVRVGLRENHSWKCAAAQSIAIVGFYVNRSESEKQQLR